MSDFQQQQTCSSISNSLGSGITLSHLQSPPQAQNGGGPARILIHSSHSVQLNSPAPASTPPTPHLSHPPLQQTYQAIMVKDESSQQQQQQQQACARPGALPSPPSADSSFTTVTHYEMPAAMQNMKEQFKRCNPRLVQYYDAPRRQLRTPYPIGNHVPAPKEPPTFAFLNGTKFYELQYERRIPPSQGMEQHISMGPPMVPPPLNRSQSMHASMMPTQFAPTPQQAPPTQQTGSSKPAPKKSRSVSDADHFHNPMMAANQQNQQMMANMQPGNGQMQQQAQPHYMPHMGQQPQQQMNSSYQMPPLNRSMSAGYMMTGGNQMMQQSMMQGQQGMPQMHQMDMNQARYGAPQNGPMSSQPQQQQQQQKPQQQQQPMMMQSQQPTPQSYSNPGSQQNVQHTQQQIEYYCSGCMNPIQQNQPYIRCNGDASCRRVFHRECSRLTPEAASRLEMESSTCKWVCDNCASLAIR
ncbi:hypothetical protein WR25_26571 [Diploscapter pachys]|uniref:PHD-type domain-containing protein n=1 Tax=Diploscapter pachys TaxID=2018661 RepID=A0A2A2KCN9_9BILA|nr:hypothetical protein WR25_26571 [Diploscapter pachys]